MDRQPEPKYDADFSKGRKYRWLWRYRWGSEQPLLVACLIPSTANEYKPDPTVKFCCEIAKCCGFGELVVVNMFATYLPGSQQKPSHAHHKIAANLVGAEDLVGSKNKGTIKKAALEVRERQGTVVVAWGDDGWSRHAETLRWLRGEEDAPLFCFGTKQDNGVTTRGFPFHPAPRGTLRQNCSSDACQVELKPYPPAPRQVGQSRNRPSTSPTRRSSRPDVGAVDHQRHDGDSDVSAELVGFSTASGYPGVLEESHIGRNP